MVDVFISYAREDRDCAEQIAKVCTEAGLVVWWDNNLLPGQNFRREIQAMIEAASATIVVWSKHALESAFVHDEASLANELGRLVPVSLDGSRPPLGFRGLHTQDIRHWTQNLDPAMLIDLIQSARNKVSETDRDQVQTDEGAQSNVAELTMQSLYDWVEIPLGPPQERIDGLKTYLERFGEHAVFYDDAKTDLADMIRILELDKPDTKPETGKAASTKTGFARKSFIGSPDSLWRPMKSSDSD